MIKAGVIGMKKTTMRAAGAVTAILALAACETDSVRGVQPEGSEFTKALALEYRDLAVFESDQMYDPADARYMARKGLAAAQGEEVPPSQPSEWRLTPADAEQGAALRSRLVTALNARKGDLPVVAARAQVAYDCWLEQEEENFQDDHIAVCYDKFIENLTILEGGVVAPTPSAATFICFFDFDSAVVDDECEAIVSLVADEMASNPGRRIDLVGNTDTSGSAAYNSALSLRRANNVSVEMGNQGIPRGLISSTGLGEENLRIPTGDGVRERENRRVEITLR